MNQKITVVAMAPSLGHSISIETVYELNNELHVLVKSKGDGGGDSISHLMEEADVDTSSETEVLPVKYYLVNSRERREDHEGHEEEAKKISFVSLYGLYENKAGNMTKGALTSFIPLPHPDEFFQRMQTGRRCFEKVIPLMPIDTLLTQQVVPDVVIPESLLQIPGLTSQLHRQLLLENPACIDILITMQQAGLFIDHPAKNHNQFAAVLTAWLKLAADPAVKPEDRDALPALYHLLASSATAPCLLTKSTHKNIWNELVEDNIQNLAKLVDILQTLQPLNQKMVDMIFVNPRAIIELDKLISNFDLSPASLHYLLENIHEPHQINPIHNALAGHPESTNWLNPETFKFIVDHLDHAYKIIIGFNILNQFNMLDSHRERFLQDKNIQECLNSLRIYDMLNKERVEAAFQQPEINLAMKICFEVAALHAFNAWDPEHQELINAIFTTPELANALAFYASQFEVIKQKIEDGGTVGDISNDISLVSRFNKEIRKLATGTIIAQRTDADAGTSVLGIFKPKVLSINECLGEFCDKYLIPQLQEDITRLGY